MTVDHQRTEELLQKIRKLSQEKIAEVFDFVDFLAHRTSDRNLTKMTEQLSSSAFASIWDNADDAANDRL